jgi:hypothetical protein
MVDSCCKSQYPTAVLLGDHAKQGGRNPMLFPHETCTKASTEMC